jgi:hypothetical protein
MIRASTIAWMALALATLVCRPAAADGATDAGANAGAAGADAAEPVAAEPVAADPVDPDLARAIEKDRATADQKQAPAPPPAQPVQPMAKMIPDLSFILDVGAAWFGKADHLMQGGHAIDDNGIAIQGLELAASSSVDPFFRFDLYTELFHLEVEEVFLTTLALPWNLQARAGLLNAAVGRQNPMHLHGWNFSNPPLSHTRFMSAEHFRGPGAELSVLLPLPWYLTLAGQALSTTSELGFASATFASSEKNGSGRIETPADLVYVLRMENFFELSPDWSLLVGGGESFGQSPYVPRGRTYLHGGDLFLKWRPVSRGLGDFALALTIEYLLRDCPTPDRRFRDHGGYAEIDAMITKRWMVGVRGDSTALFKGRSPDLEAVPGWQRRGSVSLTFLPSHFSKLRLQGDLGRDEAGRGLSHAIFIQVEVGAGEHGAHKF